MLLRIIINLMWVQKSLNFEFLQHHMRSHKKNEPLTLTCGICRLVSETDDAFEEHCKLHRGLSSLECVECHKKFSQKGGLATHMLVHVRVQFAWKYFNELNCRLISDGQTNFAMWNLRKNVHQESFTGGSRNGTPWRSQREMQHLFEGISRQIQT